jgi:methanogenic corrinoid protein MtbC1
MSGLKGSEMDVAWQESADWQSQDATTLQAPAHRAADFRATAPLYRETRQAHLTLLTKAIENEIIPRLLNARRTAAATKSKRAGGAGWQPDTGEIDHFAQLVLDIDQSLAVTHLRGLAEKGVRLEALYELLLGATARHLGRMWDDDELAFTAVTTGVWRLQEIMRSMSTAFVGMAPSRAQDARILLVPAIGGQHSFGLAMVAEHFLRAGWDVSCERAHSDAELCDLVGDSWFDIIGFSVGATDQISHLARTVSQVRKASRNLRLGVMVGGPVFVACPGRVADCGADATAIDAVQAIAMAESLMLSLARAG